MLECVDGKLLVNDIKDAINQNETDINLLSEASAGDTLPGLTSSVAELNILDGALLDVNELNILDGVTSSTAELNILDGVLASTAELNLLDGVTSTTAELNLLDGVTSTTSELNILDGVTSTAAELNILDGVTATALELNLLDGVTATTAEINHIDGVTSNIQTQIDAIAGTNSIIVRDEKVSGTHGGDFVSGAWRTRDLNTVQHNSIAGASLLANQITLPIGTYEVLAIAPSFSASFNQCQVYDTTGLAVLVLGGSDFSVDNNNSIAVGIFTLSVESVIELQHQCASTETVDGFGQGVSFGTNVFSQIKIRKLS